MPYVGDPPGTLKPFAGAAAPTGWLLCDGTAVSRTTYADLFAALGTAYGVGDGASTFNLPDLRGRVPVGKGTHTDVDTLGKSDGAAVGDRRPKHKHTVNDPGHAHQYDNPTLNASSWPNGDIQSVNPGTQGDQSNTRYNGQTGTQSASTGVTVGPQTTVPNDAPAYVVVNYIIKH